MQFMLEMKIGGGDEDADHIHAAFDRSIDILLDGPGERRDFGIQSKVADLLYGVHLRSGNNGKTGFNNLDPNFVKPYGDIQFLIGAKDYSRHLLTIAKGYIADFNIEIWGLGQGQKFVEGIILHSAR